MDYEINQKIAEIMRMQADQRLEPLRELSLSVGGSGYSSSTGTGATEAEELISQIHMAAQTKCMIDMCASATKGYEIADTATKAAARSQKTILAIALLSAIAALLGTAAAWAAVIVQACK